MQCENLTLDQERALYAISDSVVQNCRFEGPADGESALKEARDITVSGCFFDLRYPLWHVTDAQISNCQFTQNCRAALWYDKNIALDNCRLDGIKALRECDDVTINNCSANSPEFIWKCRGMTIQSLTVEESEYPFFEVQDAKIKSLTLKGKYAFQYCSEIQIENSDLDTKDAFWHAKNVTIRDSTIKSEYLGWYSENLTLINCRIVRTQPLCYCKNLTLINCSTQGCDLSFERSEVNAQIAGAIDSVKNPLCGKIQAASIGQIIMEKEFVDPSKTQFIQ